MGSRQTLDISQSADSSQLSWAFRAHSSRLISGRDSRKQCGGGLPPLGTRTAISPVFFRGDFAAIVNCPRVLALDRNPLDDIPRHPLLPPVVKRRRSRLRMPGELLHVLHRHPLLQQGGYRRHPERMRRQPRRQPGVFQPPLDQLADPVGPQRLRRQRPAPAVRRPK